jgi:uncharacterized membrane protein HdeD (DUF308 family)
MYTGRPRGSSGPVPLIILGAVFAAVGVVLQGMPLAGSIGLVFLILGIAGVAGGLAWLVVRRR